MEGRICLGGGGLEGRICLGGGGLEGRICLGGGSLEGAPGMEAAREAVGLVPLANQPQLPWVLRILGPHVLDVDLRWGNGGRCVSMSCGP